MSGGRWAARLHLPTLAVAAVVVAGWVLLSWRYGAFVLPSPLSVLRGLVDIVRSGEIWKHTAASLARIVVGFGGAVLIALALGLLAFLSRTARAVRRKTLHPARGWRTRWTVALPMPRVAATRAARNGRSCLRRMSMRFLTV